MSHMRDKTGTEREQRCHQREWRPVRGTEVAEQGQLEGRRDGGKEGRGGGRERKRQVAGPPRLSL